MATNLVSKVKFLQGLGVRFSARSLHRSTVSRCLCGAVNKDMFPARERTLLNANFVFRPFSMGIAQYSQVEV